MPRGADPRIYTNELWREAVVPAAGQRVLALGVAAEVASDWAQTAGADGAVVAVEHWLPDWRRLEVERARAPHLPLAAIFAGSLDTLDETLFDVAAIDVSAYPSSPALLRVVHAAGQRLKAGGVLYAAGPKDAGIVSFSKRLEAIFGNAQPLAYRKGQRVVAAHKLGDVAPPAEEEAKVYAAELRDMWFALEYEPAAFARGGVDDATTMLIEALEVMPGDRVADLGCGSGVVGMVAARLAPNVQVTMTDADAYALELARRNCAHNEIASITIVAADVADTIAEQRFTVVACNPPFHQRHERAPDLAQRFMRAAAALLEPGGRAYFVANRFQPYERLLSALFGNVAEVEGDERYKVLCAVKKPAGG
jgi:16S rRNA (guanine1207-N2)-methyltransferase